MDRKLVTILAADVVGYSTLMEQDERGTFERLRTGRKELFEPEIAPPPRPYLQAYGRWPPGRVRQRRRCGRMRGKSAAGAGGTERQRPRGPTHSGTHRHGKLEEARASIARLLKNKPGWTIEKEAVWPTTKQPQYAEPLLSTYLADLAKAELPEK